MISVKVSLVYLRANVHSLFRARLLENLLAHMVHLPLSRMKKSYKAVIECAICANRMEHALNQLAGIEKATVNFMLQKINLEFAAGVEPAQLLPQVIATCKKIETDFELVVK